MLGIDFIGVNFDVAKESLRRWAAFAGRETGVRLVFGISNFCERDRVLPGSPSMTPEDAVRGIRAEIPAIREIAHWTSDIDARLIHRLRQAGVASTPFYSAFNYGSVVNRLLLMAYSHGCDYLLRVDPGTSPPHRISFKAVIEEHTALIANDPGTVVSRRYADRFALRDEFVSDEPYREAHRRLVAEATGIDVAEQITGGALLSFRLPGVPAIGFPDSADGLTLVWASDDGIYQTLAKSKHGVTAIPLKEDPVARFDPVGKPKPWDEYYRGIVGAVLMACHLDGKGEKDAVAAARSFLDALKTMTTIPEDIDLDRIAPRQYRKAIGAGIENYLLLCDEWMTIVAILKDELKSLTKAEASQ